jgi:hypothetical protein
MTDVQTGPGAMRFDARSRVLTIESGGQTWRVRLSPAAVLQLHAQLWPAVVKAGADGLQPGPQPIDRP